MKRIALIIAASLALEGTSALAAEAKANYEQHCQKCHGADGAGQTAMGKKLKVKDYSDAKVQAAMKDDEMAKVIKEGKKDGDKTLMKAFGETLSDAEIKDLVKQVRSLKK